MASPAFEIPVAFQQCKSRKPLSRNHERERGFCENFCYASYRNALWILVLEAKLIAQIFYAGAPPGVLGGSGSISSDGLLSVMRPRYGALRMP